MAQPSHDVFVDDEDVVSSIVVAPLVLAAGPFGGLYVTHNLPWDEGSGFTRGKAAIVALAGLLQRCLEQHVTGDRNRTWQELCDVSGWIVQNCNLQMLDWERGIQSGCLCDAIAHRIVGVQLGVCRTSYNGTKLN